ncbi:hypothetical protein C8A01DRAFT_40344 [Parachaetomium inaequale]|uniref:MARVEL domain-containing protein n=1 Tax=Parachaetomium inaequale TaxID=2588326 RepID=A0AAN6P9F3_9PEZI|nr:hypothetical protein C8A01DRAFT_40344 [Parachaetomium inaequale]
MHVHAASRIVQAILRVCQFICSVIVLGILARFLVVLSGAGATRDGRIIYGIIVASISLVFAIVFVAPFLYSFLAFPFDFVMFVMWLVLFCLLITRTGIHTCSAPWFSNYWGFFWGGWWRNRFFIGASGCSHWRAVLAFSFVAMFTYLITTGLGAYVVSRYWRERRTDRRAGTTATTGNPPTSQIGGPTHTGGAAGNTPGTTPGTAPAGQPGTYV